MPIIINDFEVLVNRQAETSAGGQEKRPPAEVAPPAPPRPDDLLRLLWHLEARHARLRAD